MPPRESKVQSISLQLIILHKADLNAGYNINLLMSESLLCFPGFYRGSGWNGSRGWHFQNSRAPRSGTLKFDGEFDFESANAQFDKENIEKELKEKLSLGM